MKQIKYIGNHRPKGMIVDVDENVMEDAIKTGNWIRLGEEPKVVVEKKPDKSWKEMEIYDWIKKKKIPIKYRPSSDTKDYILSELKKKGYI